jgi:hypothetical protein
LRRAELLTVLGARPAERFAYFETFLGLQKIDQLIETISARRNGYQGRVATLTGKIESAIEQLRTLLPASLGKPTDLAEVIKVANEWALALSVHTTEPLDRATELKARVEAIASGDTGAFPYRLQEASERLLGARRTMESLGKTLPDLLTREANVRSALSDSADVELLTHALRHFQEKAGDTCPVCEQNVEWAPTRTRLDKRVASLKEYSDIRRKLLTETASLRDATDQARGALNEGRNVAVKLGIEASFPFEQSELARFHRLNRSTSAVEMLQSLDVRSTIDTMVAACEAAAADLARVAALVPDNRDIPELRTASAFFERLGQLQTSVELLQSERAALTNETTSLTAVVEALRRSRQDVARETLKAIQDLVSEYYFKIHPPDTPDDATGAPSIEVQRHGRGTAFVRGEFGGTEIKDPTLVYSDGHLDTVGLCIFLALRRFRSAQHGDPRIMVLDDVIISIDLGHSRRFLDLLRTSFGDHQILILTHNGLFAHWCKTLLPNLTRIEIKTWSLDGGPKVGDFASARERLESVVRNGTAKEIGVALMDLLDEWTAEARYEYQVAVPAKPGEQYTLTEIWEPLALRLKSIAKELKSDLGGVLSLLDQLKDVTHVRNALAGHYNEFAQEFPRSTIASIATNACSLIDALYCRDCVSFVVPVGNRSKPSLMECPKHHKQYLAKAPAIG